MIKGKKLILRKITRDDLPRYVTWLNDIEVSKHISLYGFLNLDDETDWYEQQRKQSNLSNFAIDTIEGQHIGSISLMNIDHRVRLAELGIVIGDKNYWSKGYGHEAIELLLAYGFNTLNLNRIFLRVDTDHPSGIKCYQRCGFTIEGEVRHVEFREGNYINQYLMSILREEYVKVAA